MKLSMMLAGYAQWTEKTLTALETREANMIEIAGRKRNWWEKIEGNMGGVDGGDEDMGFGKEDVKNRQCTGQGKS